MSLTQLRDTLASVSDAVPVPVPDAAAFERRVTGVRRRRATARVAGAVAAVAVAGGSLLTLGGAGQQRLPVAPKTTASDVPVVVGGHLRTVSGDDGVLGPVGPAVASIVGATPQGVVVLTEDGTLGRVVDGDLDQVVPGRVRTAFLDGVAVVYEDDAGQIRWRQIEPTVATSDSAQTEQGRLMAAGGDVAVVAVVATDDHRGLVAHDADGVHPLSLSTTVTVVTGVDVAGGIVAVRTDQGVQFIESGGTNLTELPGRAVGSLAPDGGLYAEVARSGHDVTLIDPRAGVPSPGPELSSGTIRQVGWTADGDLLLVVDNTLWRCVGVSQCRPQVTVTGALRLH